MLSTHPRRSLPGFAGTTQFSCPQRKLSSCLVKLGLQLGMTLSFQLSFPLSVCWFSLMTWASCISSYSSQYWSEVKVAQLCPTLCNPMDCRVHGVPQARTLEWVAFPFSRGSSQPRDWTQVSHIAGRFFTSWAPREAHEYWSGWPIPSPADLPDPGIKLGSPALQAILYQLNYQGNTH